MQGSAAASGASKRRVMVVADPGRESAGALQWALSHAVLEQDELILLHVEPPNSRRGTFSSFRRRPTLQSSGPNSQTAHGNPTDGGGGEYEWLEVMRTTCEAAQPKVKVLVERADESKDKATTILNQSIAMSADLLVIGQPRRSNFLGGKLGGGMSGRAMDTAEYLIENSKCLCVGVQKKGQNAGYLLNTKTHKNFWLLA